jgi:molybdenum cofactor cytidylyltransferase
VLPGKMVATSKIISYGVPAERLARAIENVTCRLSVEPVRAQRAVLIQTQLPTIKSTVLDKTRSVTERRLGARHVTLSGEQRCVHEVTALTNVLQSVVDTDLILIAGASAISDRADVVPAAIVEAGGTVHRYGIPVDPGNLLLLGELAGCQVIGLPGCARSAKLNGLDLLLNRIACGVEIDNDWLNGLSVGGLLSEMHDRPQPRVSQDLHRPAKVAALVLAAGTSKRAGPQNKLLCESNGIPMIKRVVDQVTSSRLTDVHVVTGHEHQRVEQALAGSRCKTHYCASYDLGMAHSLSHGISRLGDVDAVMVILGDMPEVSNAVIDQLLAFDSTQIIDTIRVPVFQGTRGNPVIVGKSFFDTLLQHTGDTGAKFLMRQYPDLVVEVPVEEAGVLVDYDTPEALARLNSNC